MICLKTIKRISIFYDLYELKEIKNYIYQWNQSIFFDEIRLIKLATKFEYICDLVHFLVFFCMLKEDIILFCLCPSIYLSSFFSPYSWFFSLEISGNFETSFPDEDFYSVETDLFISLESLLLILNIFKCEEDSLSWTS